MSESSLSNGWRKFRFDEMATIVNDRVDDPSKANVDHYVGLEHLDSDSLRIRRWGSPTDVEATKLRFRAGDIIFGRRRAYQRKLGVAHFDGICSAHAMVLRARRDVALPEFLPFFMQSNLFMERAKEISVGSLSPTINWNALAKEEFALPTLNEQQRLGRMFACFEDYSEHFNSIRLHLDLVITSLLKGMWLRFPLRTIQELIDEGTIDRPQDGNHGSQHPTASDYVESGIPFVMATDLRDGLVDFESCKKIPAELANSLRIGFAQPGDVLISHKGTVGNVARLLNAPTNFVMLTPQVTYYRVRDHHALHPDWLFFSFVSPGFQRLLEQYGKQSTRAYVGITTQRQLRIPYCSRDEQVEFLAPLWSAEKAMSAIRNRADHAKRLRRMFVEKTFLKT